MTPIHVINPNASGTVTDAIRDAALARFPDLHGRAIFKTLADGPPGIVTQADADRAATLVADYVRRNAARASAFVIGCFSDPGLFAAREACARPVIGIGAAGIGWAAALGARIGVVAIGRAGIARHRRHYAALGLADLVAGERAIDLAPADSGSGTALVRIIEAATALRDRDGAQVIVLGCAGMSLLREEVEDAVGLPVVDPVIAGVALAIERAGGLGNG